MAAKVETLRIGTQVAPRPRSFARTLGSVRRWFQQGQIGSSDLEMRTYTGAR
jgi:hypothetical protein